VNPQQLSATEEDQADLPGPLPGERHFWGLLSGAVALAAVIQAIVLAAEWRDPFKNGDAIYYAGQAQLNTQGHWFDQYYWYLYTQLHGLGTQYLPSASHPPVATLVYTLADWVGLTTWREHSVVLSGIFLGVVVLAGVVGRLAATPRAGIVAAYVVATYAYLWINPVANLSETFVLVGAGLLLWAILRFLRRPRWWTAVEIGVWAGVCALTRSELVSLTVLVVVPSIWLLYKVAWPRRLQVLAWCAVGFLVISAPWLIRNQTTFKDSVWFSDQAGVTLLDANCPMTYHGYYTGWWWHACGLRATIPAGLDESQADAVKQRVAMAYIRAHKVRAAEVVVVRVARTWNLYDPKAQVLFDYQDARPHWASWIALAEFYPLAILAIVGGFAQRRRRRPLAPFVGLLLAPTLAVAMTFANGRYRVEGDLAMALLAAIGVDFLLERRTSRRNLQKVPHELAPSANLSEPATT